MMWHRTFRISQKISIHQIFDSEKIWQVCCYQSTYQFHYQSPWLSNNHQRCSSFSLISVYIIRFFDPPPFQSPPQSYQNIFHYYHYWYCCSLVKRPQSFHVNRKTRRQPYQKPNLFISCTFQLLLIYFHEFLNEFCSSLCCFVTTRGRVQISCCLAQSPIRQRLPTYVKAEANQQRT